MSIGQLLLYLYVLCPGLVQASSGIISADTFTSCSLSNAQIIVTDFNFNFSKADSKVNFNVAGSSNINTAVTAQINVTAYGISAYEKAFDPCASPYNISQLCPMVVGPFIANGALTLPADIVADIPNIVFAVPDLSGMIMMNLYASDGAALTCLEALVGNGRTLASSSIQAGTAAIAAGAIMISGAASVAASLSAAGAFSTGSGATVVSSSPNMGDMLLWFQAIGMNGMLSIEYPSILRSFYNNFGWTLGLGPWTNLQSQIDDFRRRTGGNLTQSSLATLDKSSAEILTSSSVQKRNLTQLWKRSDIVVARSSTNLTNDSSTTEKVVEGFSRYVEQLRVPSQNAFTTIFLISLIIIGSVVAISVVGKLLLDLGFRFGKLPRKLRGVRLNYWSIMIGILLRIILVLFGTWSLFCLHQFRHGDSWAATLLAAITLALFTGVILSFTIQITRIAWQTNGFGQSNAQILYHHKPHLQKFGLFYDQFKERFWWFFIPCLLYSFVKAFFIAFGDNHGLIQVIGCMACEFTLLTFLFTTKAYDGKQANVVNMLISCVRLVSLIGTLLFVDLLGLRETTKTVAGVVLIVIQSLLSLILAFLVVFNGVMPLFRRNSAGKETKTQEESLPLDPYAVSKDESIHHTNSASYIPYQQASAMSVLSVQSLNSVTKAEWMENGRDYFKTLQVDNNSVHSVSDLDLSTPSRCHERHNSDTSSILASIYDSYDNEHKASVDVK